MSESDDQSLRKKAAECRERAGRARDEKQRTLWLGLAEEIAYRLRQDRAGERHRLDA